MKLTITGYSTALFASWYFIEELGVLFDAGDGVTSALLQKSRKIKHVFLSHADRDHLTGLFQLNQLNARPGFPVMYYPKNSGSFPAMESFSKSFDQQVSRTLWQPVQPGERHWIKGDMYVEPIINGHVVTAGSLVKSLSYKVMQTKQKLKPELSHVTGEELRKLSEQNGKESISYEVSRCVLGYSGDTPVEDMARWNNCDILIHEATFLGNGEDVKLRTHGNRHSNLHEVMNMVSQLSIGTLILGHFSSRYSPAQIDKQIRELCNVYALIIPVYRLLPGHTIHDILSQTPLNG